MNLRSANNNWQQFRQAKVGIDDWSAPAYVLTDEQWNGFAIVFFPRESADAVIEHWLADNRSIGYQATAGYDAATDTYTFRWRIDDDGDFDEEVAKGRDWTDENGNVLHLYCIGGWAWCWIEQEQV